MSNSPVAVVNLEDDERARAVAERLGLPLLPQEDFSPEALWLQWKGDTLSLHFAGASMEVDFLEHFQKLKKTAGFAKASLLAKAIGGSGLLVLDATAGLGRDSLLLAGFGHQVMAIERNPVLFELLLNGKERAQREPLLAEILSQISWRCVDFEQWEPISPSGESGTFQFSPDVIYLDPMYPAKKKSALPKKEMQILQELLGATESSESERLLDLASRSANQRVVVKRPLSAEHLLAMPTHSYRGKTVRYDMYRVPFLFSSAPTEKRESRN